MIPLVRMTRSKIENIISMLANAKERKRTMYSGCFKPALREIGRQSEERTTYRDAYMQRNAN